MRILTLLYFQFLINQLTKTPPVLVQNSDQIIKIHQNRKEKLSQFDLCREWKQNKDGVWHKGKVLESQSPQIAFIDRCLDFLKEGGRLGIVLPDGVLSNTTEKYIRHSISQRAELIGVIDLPMSTFLPSTPTKTHLLFLRKKSKPDFKSDLFLSYAKTCGHDKRGVKTPTDNIREIPQYLKKLKNNNTKTSSLGLIVNHEQLKNNIWLPKYYNPEIDLELEQYDKKDYDITSIEKLIKDGIITMSMGDEIGSKNYGIGDIPFIRTSEIANLEVITDPTHCTSNDIYDEYKEKQNIQNEDILMVCDGTYLIGRCAMITDLDTKIIIQSHFKQFKIKDREKMSPYLLLALINLGIVQKQLESKSFRQGTISALRDRIVEIKLPIPKDETVRKNLIDIMQTAIEAKREAKASLLNFNFNSKIENLMGIKNRGSQGNL